MLSIIYPIHYLNGFGRHHWLKWQTLATFLLMKVFFNAVFLPWGNFIIVYSLHSDRGKLQTFPQNHGSFGNIQDIPTYLIDYWLQPGILVYVLILQLSVFLRLTLSFINRMPEFFRNIEYCMLSIQCNSSCSGDSSLTKHIIIFLIQSFCSMLCNHKRSIAHVRIKIVLASKKHITC